MADDIIKVSIDTDTASSLTSIAKYTVAIGAAAMAVGKATKVAKELIAAYRIQEQAEIRLSSAIRATGGDVSRALPKYQDFASAIQSVTTYGDEVVLSLMAQAKFMGIADDEIENATKGAIGLADAFGIDLNTALKGVANAQNGNYEQLARYIPALRSASTEAEKHAILQKSMGDGFQLAQDRAKTATGQMEQLKNAIGDMKEMQGKAISEAISPFVGWLLETVSASNKAKESLNALKKVTEEGVAGQALETLQQSLVAAKKDLDLLTSSADENTFAMTGIIGASSAQIEAQKKLIKQIEIQINFEKGLAINREQAAAAAAKAKVIESDLITSREENAERQLKINEMNAMSTEQTRQAEMDAMTAVADHENAMIAKRLEKQQAFALAEEELMAYRYEAATVFFGGLSELAAVFGEESKEMMLVSKALAGAEAGINSYLAFTKALAQGGIWGVAAAAGILASGLAAQAKIFGIVPKFAQGGEFVTSGPQMIMVGDNATGRERVSVDPIGNRDSSGGAAHIQVYLNERTIIDAMTRASSDGRLIISQRGIR